MRNSRPVKPAKEHYRKVKGWRRQDGRPVYMVRMSEAEVRGRRTTIGIGCSLAVTMAAMILWVVSMI